MPDDSNSSALRISRALLSVSDKRGIEELARVLLDHGAVILSTGGTARALDAAGIAYTKVEDATGQAEIMDGRVKTLQPIIHGGILADRDTPEHISQLSDLGGEPIDLVCVNLYPFEETIRREGVTPTDAIENIDIGGPAMIRAAAKNAQHVAVLTDVSQYERVIAEIRDQSGIRSDLRAELALAAFERTAAYDAAIAAWMAKRPGSPGGLRYGENPQQAPAFVRPHVRGLGVPQARQLHGKQLGYNNYLDADAALALVRQLHKLDPSRAHSCVLKHTNPCGCSSASDTKASLACTFAGDPLAAFGGIVASSARIDRDAAELLCRDDVFFEVVLAPAYDADALDMLTNRWKNLRVLELAGMHETAAADEIARRIEGGTLLQPTDSHLLSTKEIAHAAGPEVGVDVHGLARFADQIGRALWSNAVCICRIEEDGAYSLVGVGSGCVDRVTACKVAVEKAGDRARGALAFSDGFFPFADGPGVLIDAGVSVIVHPGGSKRDGETFAACDEAGVTCMTTGIRRFRH